MEHNSNFVYKTDENCKKKYLVIDVGGTFVKYAVMDEDGSFIEKDKRPVEKESLNDFIDMLVSIYESTAGEVEGIAISAPGMIDSESGFMYNGGSIFCIENINIVDILQRRCKVPVSVENDAKCAGLAEVWKGALSDCRNGVAMIIGTAVGGAVIVDRKVLHGRNFMAGEFSYIFTNADEYSIRRKLSAEANGVPGLIRMVSARLGIPEKELNGEKIFALANQGDEKVRDVLRAYCRQIAIQISNFQYVVDPDRVVIGGGISVQPLFLQLVKEELRTINEVFPYQMPIPEVAACKFFNDANLIGALYVHLSSRKTEADRTKVS
ncbi:MAG: ROK family protein [Eubacteriales bacterium]|nr:ROK family protein [Eubacteriales bacterium]